MARQLGALQALADGSSRAKQGARMQAAADAYAAKPVQCAGLLNKLFGNAVSDLAFNIGGSIASVVSPVQSSAPRHGPCTGRGFGTFVEARLVPGQYKEGTRTGGAPANPTWDALTLRRTESGEQMYIQGHLLNFHLGGSGHDWANLVPLTARANMRHSGVAEQAVKDAAVTPGQEVVYRVRPVYGSWPWQWPTAVVRMVGNPLIAGLAGGTFGALARLHEAEQHVPSALQCDWWVTDRVSGKTSAYSANIRQDFGDGKMRVQHNGQSHDVTDQAWVWGLIEQGVATALRYALLAGPIEAAARVAVQAMTAEQLLLLLRRLCGGPANALATILASGVTGAAAAAQLLCERYGWGGLSALILGMAGPLPGGTRDAPVYVNRELRNTRASLTAEERELMENPSKRESRPTEHFVPQ